MSARDLAATVPLTERLMATATEYAHAAPYGQPLVVGLLREAAAALAALEKQAGDAQAERDAAVFGREVEFKVAQGATVLRLQAEARAVRAEEALRLGREFVATTSYYRQRKESRPEFEAFAVALASAGADTP